MQPSVFVQISIRFVLFILFLHFYTKYMANMYLLLARVEVLDVDILRTEEALILFVGDAHSPKVTLHEMALSCKLRSRK